MMAYMVLLAACKKEKNITSYTDGTKKKKTITDGKFRMKYRNI